MAEHVELELQQLHEKQPEQPEVDLLPQQQKQELKQAHLTIVAQTTPVISVVPSTPNAQDATQGQPATGSSSRQLFREAANAHGGLDSLSLMQHEVSHMAATQLPKVNSDSSMVDATVSRNPSTIGGRGHEKKIGHRRVAEGGEVTYKKIKSKQIMGSIQLGIQHTVGSLASKPKRDLLMNDFWEMESIGFPPDGSSLTPAHHYSEFRFKVYAPIAFRYFRDLFNIEPDDFLISMCASPLRELSNPGASGSIFYLTNDDEFIIKTVQKKECEFLQKLLPAYYMNLSQNPRTLLPKFFGLYCFHYNSKNVRLVAMNNLLPSDIKMHCKYDLKGSTFKRKASKAERLKACPTYKDLDFLEHHPDGIFLEADNFTALMSTIKRDCMVLESFQIMDYSLLVGIHNLDEAAKERKAERSLNARAKLMRKAGGNQTAPHAVADDDAPEVDQAHQLHASQPGTSAAAAAAAAASASAAAAAASTGGTSGLNRTRSMNRQRLVAHSTAMESITAGLDAMPEEGEDEPQGGIPARSMAGDRLLLYIGIIDILQSYRLEKKLEHTFKSILYNGDTVSVCRPSFYAKRFQETMEKVVFKKTPTFGLKHSPSKRKTSATQVLRTPLARIATGTTGGVAVNGGGGGGGGGGVGGGGGATAAAHPVGLTMSGDLTPPPAFDDISEEDITAEVSSTTLQQPSSYSNINNNHQHHQHHHHQAERQSAAREVATRVGSVLVTGRQLQSPYSYDSSMRSSSAMTSDYSDDESTTGNSHSNGNLSSVQREARSRSLQRTLQLTKTSVQVTTVGYVEELPSTQTENHVNQTVATEVANGKSTVLYETTKTAHIQGPSYKTTLLFNEEPR